MKRLAALALALFVTVAVPAGARAVAATIPTRWYFDGWTGYSVNATIENPTLAADPVHDASERQQTWTLAGGRFVAADIVPIDISTCSTPPAPARCTLDGAIGEL